MYFVVFYLMLSVMTTKYFYVATDKTFVSKQEQRTTVTENAVAPHLVSYLCHVPGKVSLTVMASNVRVSEARQA